MIRYSISKGTLLDQIESHKPGWFERARSRTEQFRRAGKYIKGSDIWSEIKEVFMKLQGEGKCIFCERQLESVEFGLGEQAVEHFRPKGKIKAWSLPKELDGLGISLSAPPPKSGYHLLAYNPLNYAACCNPCNSILKRDYFPIMGAYNTHLEDPTMGGAERPCLLYPISDLDEDPETLIGFLGPVPVPKQTTGDGFFRAVITLAFFELANPLGRKNLFRDRARSIIGLFPLLEARHPKVPDFLRDSQPHANCLRSFARLYETDPAKAKAIFNTCIGIAAGSS